MPFARIPRRLAFVASAAALLAGCAGMSPSDNQRLQREVAGKAAPGAALADATQALTQAGFTCDKPGTMPSLQCARYDGSALLYTCVHRVTLGIDADRRAVTAVDVAPILCAGL